MGRLNDRLASLPNGIQRISRRTSGWHAKGWWHDDNDPNFVRKPKKEPPPRPGPTQARPPIVRKKKDTVPSFAVAPTATANHAAEQAVVNLKRWRAEPWTFVKEVLGAIPDVWQDEALHALATNQRLAIKACKGPGKSAFDSWAVLWFLTCFSHPKILCTSITGDNLRDGLWAECAKWMNRSPMLKELFEWQTERIYAKDHAETWFASARTWSKQADKTQQANTLAGIHAKNTLIIVDEAGDIPSGVVAAADASLSTQGNEGEEVHKIILTGNPTRTSGPLWDACTRDRHLYYVIEITGDPDSPKRASRIDINWARELIRQWGAESPIVLVNVMGKFPPVQADKLLGPDEVQAAMQRTVPEIAWMREPKIMALDVARFGDDRSVLCRRQGQIVFPFRKWRNLDLMELASQVAFEYGEWQADVIFVDETGVGAGVVDRLRQLAIPVVGINFSSKPQEVRFADKRSEIWYRMAEAVKRDLCLPDDAELASELVGPSFKFDRNSKMRLESKDDMKKNGLPSPDAADSLAMTWAEPVHGEAHRPSYTKTYHQTVTDYDPFASKGEYDGQAA